MFKIEWLGLTIREWFEGFGFLVLVSLVGTLVVVIAALLVKPIGVAIDFIHYHESAIENALPQAIYRVLGVAIILAMPVGYLLARLDRRKQKK